MSIDRHDALERRMAAFLREFLILDLDRDDARLLIAAHGVMHVEQAAVAGVGVGDHAGVHGARQRRDPVEHLRIGGDAGVGQAIGGGRQPEAGGIDEIEPDLVGDHGRDHVVQAWRGHEFAGAQRLAETCAWSCHTSLTSRSPSVHRLPLAHELRNRNGDHEPAAIEQILHEAVGAKKVEAEDAGRQEIDRDERAPGVEAAGKDRGRAEKRRREGRQQKGEARTRIGRTAHARIEHAGEAPR